VATVWLLPGSYLQAADRVIIGNVSRTMEQLPNYAASDKGFFAQEGIQGDVVLIGSTDTLIQALIAAQVNVAIVDPSAAINAVERSLPKSYRRDGAHRSLHSRRLSQI